MDGKVNGTVMELIRGNCPATFEEIAAQPWAQRLYRDVEVKRRILDAHAEHPTKPEGFCRTCGSTQGACETKRLLALSYSDHPDYDESGE